MCHNCKNQHKHKNRRCKSCYKDANVIKAVLPEVLQANNNVQNLIRITDDVQAQQYITPPIPDLTTYNNDETVFLELDISDVENITNIDHIAIDIHVKAEYTQDIAFNMVLKQTVRVDDPTLGDVVQSQDWLYWGHEYTLEGRKWSKIGERWDRPRNLGILKASISDESNLSGPRLILSFYGVEGKLLVDKTIQLHIEWQKY